MPKPPHAMRHLDTVCHRGRIGRPAVSERTFQWQKPTHCTLFHVIEGKDGKDNFWLKIGAGWEHKDGDGISLDFEVFPTKTGRVTLRRMKDDEG